MQKQRFFLVRNKRQQYIDIKRIYKPIRTFFEGFMFDVYVKYRGERYDSRRPENGMV